MQEVGIKTGNDESREMTVCENDRVYERSEIRESVIVELRAVSFAIGCRCF